MSNWIKVEERLPPHGDMCDVWRRPTPDRHGGLVRDCKFMHGGFHVKQGDMYGEQSWTRIENVSHWMPMPEAPPSSEWLS